MSVRHWHWLRGVLGIVAAVGLCAQVGCGTSAETKTAPAPNDGSGMGIPGGGPAAGTSANFPDMPKAAK